MNIIEIMYKCLHKYAEKYFNNETIKQVLNLNYTEIKNYVKNLYFNNNKYKVEHKLEKKLSLHFVNKYSQLPCSHDTRQKRAALFEEKNFHDKRILLLGDDDLLSIELSCRYFKHITVVDCDKNLLEKIKKFTEKSIYPLTLIHVDLKDGLPDSLLKKFDVVSFDPPQNSNGFKLFLSWALKSLKDDVSFLFIMINSDIFKQIDFNEYLTNISFSGYTLVQKYASFNCYPLNTSQSFLLKIGAYFLLTKQERNRAKLNYYFSDCFEFENYRNFEPKSFQFADLSSEVSFFPTQQGLLQDL